MITCNRCGNVAPAGAVQCQRCGAPLSNKVENTYNKGMGGQEQGGQTELPAWLESLRVGERPAAPAKSPSSFSGRDLIEEGSLPGWMRPEQNSGNQPVPPSPSSPALRSASFPAPNTDANMNENALGAQGFTARSLIDEQALPSWMKEGSGQGSSTETPAPSNIAASSLVQPDALPDWMKNLQPPAPSNARPAQPSGRPGPNSGMYPAAQPAKPPATPIMPPMPPTPPSQPLQASQPASALGFSAHDLIDQNALPSWMSSQGSAESGAAPNKSGGMPPVVPPTPPSQPLQASQPASALGFSAHDLIDQNALPSWMSPQGAAESGAAPNKPGGMPPAQPGQPGQPGQNGFSASSLLDADSLPPWLKENGQQQGGSAALSQPAAQQNMQAAPTNNAPGLGISGASFIDKDALPDWLRTVGEPQQQAPMGGARPGMYGGGQQRVENMRVPSRPRGEINPAEGSEVAANVFASMLGVASAAPNFPASPASPMATPPQASPRPPAPPVWSPSQQGPVSMANAPMGGLTPPPQQQGRPPVATNNIPGTPQPPAGNQQAQGYLGVYGGPQPGIQNNYAMGNPPVGSPQIPVNGPGMPPMPGAAGQIGDERSDMKQQAKRGLFNSIREWFFR